jgi:hypothetical protein
MPFLNNLRRKKSKLRSNRIFEIQLIFNNKFISLKYYNEFNKAVRRI